MKGNRVVVAGLALLLITSAFGQTPQEGFLDVFMVKVKPEKRAEFDAVIKRMVDANRRNKGDYWLATDIWFGESNTVYFTSARQNWAGIEKGMEMFMGAIAKTLGQAGATKLLQDFNNCVISSRTELRRRRWELSSNTPSDPVALSRMIGESRWIRTTMVRLRAGHTAEYETQLRAIKAAAEKGGSKNATLVSQAVAGHQGTVFYLTALRNSLASFDDTGKPMREMLGEEGYQKYVKTLADSVVSTETTVSRFVPELSNAPEEIASVAPDYWHPKPLQTRAKAVAPPGSKTETGRNQR